MNFKIINGMMYTGFDAIGLQPRGEEKKDVLKADLTYSGLDEDTVDPMFPLTSKNTLLYIGQEDDDPTQFKALIMPALNNPDAPTVPEANKYEICYEFFYYHDEDFIIYVMSGNGYLN